ncbi:unnamed protein product [Zymoseptoria tritici ST99CH_1A5]|uniref:Ubiquitin-like domain-containing protein n=2 Tax=Zymoseptoria tritici TaxID=1047171 RepID=F9WZ46_ZYMTI|nr:uncharacterized protein MYCGRDRAFT_34686 [Zymoseptoria tritici IPO323]EGP91129.1 hypothetical protein MYCGRDRAFT_34686 [Zymoseptoria tritici IPO323]SMY19282.1 unnamed protein product [Zymoseptoria tritici ST99CH_1A5]
MATEERPVDVVVRFSSSNADVVLTIARPKCTSVLSLKQLLRARLDPPASTSRLRLIHSGKVLADKPSLSKSLNIIIPPPSRLDEASPSAKAKGKLPVRDIIPPAARVYIHCSIGDELASSELASEVNAAREADAALENGASKVEAVQLDTEQQDTSTTPPPRGFDRLLSTGFTVSEVATLRAQFLAIQSHTHTPDTMPTGAELLALEERWLDNGSEAAAGVGTGDGGGFGAEDAGGLEDMLYGNLVGFFWPIGAMCWLMREEGVWSRRRQIAVLSGFLVNLTFGFARVMN